MQPMRCLCKARSCRGFIGGTGEAVALGGTGEAVAREQDLEDPMDASLDPEPIMVDEREAADPALVAILESEVGLASEFWDAAVWQRCASLLLSLCDDSIRLHGASIREAICADRLHVWRYGRSESSHIVRMVFKISQLLIFWK